ncbi:Metal-binding trascriptional regulator, contains putative Fe-S cluster and ArsR family DNA binding domain [Anaerovirgula multivorans]|uniref:Metal-binding trascriptional regulator, contains putative Fe-S cluster and ArsR family DNA binding domain n=1 Tax=Anaerovirgula multivorans TaxID=312168 RepID=A0A239AUZ2_9FIRM|nr:(Fe-S)-binding protein [Anaerovirgula multivorans]SNR98854.1 Metal-binding trascriptional regulator, contains putative Fe-S cluster and ArsR family DNA binding domain [Anaerovirgula multivorans]
MFLEEVKMNFIKPCTTDAGKMQFKAKFSRNISQIFPYINAVLKNSSYNHKAASLTFKKEFKIITLFPEKLAVAKIINESEAYEIMDLVKDLVNNTYEKIDEIEPLYEIRERPSAIEIYKNLPKLNCRKCGVPTCLAFASKLLEGQINAKNCLPLHEESNKEKLEGIENMMQMLGYEI